MITMKQVRGAVPGYYTATGVNSYFKLQIDPQNKQHTIQLINCINIPMPLIYKPHIIFKNKNYIVCKPMYIHELKKSMIIIPQNILYIYSQKNLRLIRQLLIIQLIILIWY